MGKNPSTRAMAKMLGSFESHPFDVVYIFVGFKFDPSETRLNIQQRAASQRAASLSNATI